MDRAENELKAYFEFIFQSKNVYKYANLLCSVDTNGLSCDLVKKMKNYLEAGRLSSFVRLNDDKRFNV